MPPTDYRIIEAAGWWDGFRGSYNAVIAVPVLLWTRAITSRIRHRKSDPDVVEGHRVIGPK